VPCCCLLCALQLQCLACRRACGCSSCASACASGVDSVCHCVMVYSMVHQWWLVHQCFGGNALQVLPMARTHDQQRTFVACAHAMSMQRLANPPHVRSGTCIDIAGADRSAIKGCRHNLHLQLPAALSPCNFTTATAIDNVCTRSYSQCCLLWPCEQAHTVRLLKLSQLALLAKHLLTVTLGNALDLILLLDCVAAKHTFESAACTQSPWKAYSRRHGQNCIMYFTFIAHSVARPHNAKRNAAMQ
jgi:hypothetical protein